MWLLGEKHEFLCHGSVTLGKKTTVLGLGKDQ